MSGDPMKARSFLEQAIALGNRGNPQDFAGWKETARVALRVALGPGDSTLERFEGIRYGLMAFSSGTPQSVWDSAKQRGVREGIAMLEAALLELDAATPSVPSVSVGALHSWVAGMAASLWDSGHKRQAVEEAARSVEVQLKAKLGVDSGTGAPLVTDAFSLSDPKAGQARLRFLEFPAGSESWKNAHEGAMSFGRGCMMRVRNLYNHGHEPPEAEVLEALASLSLLARWVDSAEVVRSDP
jgi:hypothetical protein